MARPLWTICAAIGSDEVMNVLSKALRSGTRRPSVGSAAFLAGASTLGFRAAFGGAERVSAQGNPTTETQAFVERTCSTCHAYALATSKGHTEREWLGIVNRMVALGAPLSTDQVSMVSAYLAEALKSDIPDILPGHPGSGRPDPGAIVCSCFGVGINTIREAIVTQRLASVEAIGWALQAGTNCGTCRAELKTILSASDVPLAAE